MELLGSASVFCFCHVNRKQWCLLQYSVWKWIFFALSLFSLCCCFSTTVERESAFSPEESAPTTAIAVGALLLVLARSSRAIFLLYLFLKEDRERKRAFAVTVFSTRWCFHRWMAAQQTE
jgi:hypothetical protein